MKESEILERLERRRKGKIISIDEINSASDPHCITCDKVKKEQ